MSPVNIDVIKAVDIGVNHELEVKTRSSHMKTKIVSKKDGVDIQVGEIGPHTDELLAAFKECQEGKCSCPTQEYEKVESLSVEQSKEGISLSVKAKAGQQIDIAEIEKCLEHTKNRVE